MKIIPWSEFQSGNNFPAEKVQIYSALYDLEDSSNFFHILSEPEKNRAFRLKDRAAAKRQIISRGILRLLLGKYAGVQPDKLVFDNNEFGKPYFSYPMDLKIGFNLTHSGNLLLLAFALKKQIGLDVEKIDEDIDFKGISNLAFSQNEQLLLSSSIDPINEFYKIWTAKEAILKAMGRGFSYPSNQFSVSISEGKTTFSEPPVGFKNDCSCLLSSFSPAPGYSAAVAISL